MYRTIWALVGFFVIFGISLQANEIDYSGCQSLHDVIEKETQEIASTSPADHDELAQLYVSRGESYLLDEQYENAAEDFQIATSHLGLAHNLDMAPAIAFRVAFGGAVCYDNLGMQTKTQQCIEQLQIIVSHAVCNDCSRDNPCLGRVLSSVNTANLANSIIACKNLAMQIADNYSDILGPDKPPSPGWCEEVVVGVGQAMDAIACLAPNYAVKIVLIGVIEALITRGVKCCQTGGFWKACVAPITRKWREWNNNKERHIIPNSGNLYLYQ